MLVVRKPEFQRPSESGRMGGTMNQFRTVFFGGYDRASVNEYVDGLIRQTELAQKELEAAKKALEELEAKHAEMAELEKKQADRIAALEELPGRLQTLETQLQQQRQEFAVKEDDYIQQIDHLKKELDEQKNGQAAVSHIFAKAQQEADAIISEARLKAVACRREADAEICARGEIAERDFARLRQRIICYLDGLDQAKSGLADVCSRLEGLARQMPLHLVETVSPGVVKQPRPSADVALETQKDGHGLRAVDAVKKVQAPWEA